MRGWGSRRLASALLGGPPPRGGAGAAALRRCSGGRTGPGPGPGPRAPFDRELLQFLVCPLSKKPLRYEESTNELINEELGIAYPIIDGIPNMIPQAARMIARKAEDEESKQT